MTTLGATLKLYQECLRETARAIPRSAWAIVALLAAHVFLTVAARLLMPFGLAGGFALGFLHAAAVGWYLSLVEIGVSGRRRVLASDLKDNLGTYLWEVISVLFVFWIASMVLQMLSPEVVAIATLLATLLFNPVPEQIYQDRSQSVALLQDSLKFMQRNWPEWLGAHLFAALALVAWGVALGGGSLSTALGVALLQIFGPWFGFINAGGLALAEASVSALGILGGLALLIFVHAFLIFRGHLYLRLNRSSRRTRAWQARVG